MATETIEVRGRPTETLKELLRPNLRAVFIGLNPSPVSVARGHYYQGRLGKRFWTRLQTFSIMGPLPEGREDEVAFAAGLGFADLVRRPTRNAGELTSRELEAGACDLVGRLLSLGHPPPVIVFVFAKAASAARPIVERSGFRTTRMPGPYAKKEDEETQMRALAQLLRI